jgi:hypothetical protein
MILSVGNKPKKLSFKQKKVKMSGMFFGDVNSNAVRPGTF